MRRWWLGLLPPVVIAMGACRSNPAPGSFAYVCPNGDDAACYVGVTGPFPAVMGVGADFRATFHPNPGAGLPTLASDTPSTLDEVDGTFAFLRPGTSRVLAVETGNVVDSVDVEGEEIAAVQALDLGPARCALATADGGTLDTCIFDAGAVSATLRPMNVGDSNGVFFVPVDSLDRWLAGLMPLGVTSSDEGVVSVTPFVLAGGHVFTFLGMAPGTAIVAVTVQGKTFLFSQTISP